MSTIWGPGGIGGWFSPGGGWLVNAAVMSDVAPTAAQLMEKNVLAGIPPRIEPPVDLDFTAMAVEFTERQSCVLFLIRAIPVTTGQPVKAEVTIPSDTVAGQALQEQILRQLEDLQFGDQDLFGVRLALEEALVNAIKHGNRLDPAKNVRVQWCVDDVQVVIEIEDEGEGFDPGDVPDPTADENLERPCGRGIHLMRAFMTSIEYFGRGNRVVLVKARSAAEEEPAEESAPEEG